MVRPPDDPSIEHEPHLKPGGFRPDPSEQRAARRLAREQAGHPDEVVDHGVWDEPSLSDELTADVAGERRNYASWLREKIDQTSLAKSLLVSLLMALAAGPLAVFGAFYGADSGGVLGLVIMGPLVEEVMKVALPLWAAERRPYLFKSGLQILLCAFAGGLAFAVIENLLYLNVYVPDPSRALVVWRWTVCVALHISCSTVAGIGLYRMWDEAMTRQRRPQMPVAGLYLVLAVVGHGLYNALAFLLEMVHPF
jgi:hypothetical protein